MKTKISIVGIKGFTLLELIIVLFIIGLIASVVLFSTSKIYDKTRFNEEARRLVQTIKHARNISLLERKNIELKIDVDNNKYWIDYGDEKHSNAHSLPQNFIINGEAVIFYPKGNSSGGSISIKNGKGQEYQIEIDPVLGTPSIKRV